MDLALANATRPEPLDQDTLTAWVALVGGHYHGKGEIRAGSIAGPGHADGMGGWLWGRRRMKLLDRVLVLASVELMTPSLSQCSFGPRGAASCV